MHRFLVVTLVTLAGCGSRVHLGDDVPDAGGVDASPVDAGSPCGAAQCGPGEVCCGSVCGGGGGVCVPAGTTCDVMACSCSSDADCDMSQYCLRPSCSMLGTCTPRPTGCVPDPAAPTCGCDGTTYMGSCMAGVAGVSVAHDGACTDRCAPDGLTASGPCPAVLGYHWDGRHCVVLGGCSCDGTGCVTIFSDPVSCEQAHAGCAPCGALDADAVGSCDMTLGWSWDGYDCVTQVGCSCMGADCGVMYETQESCQAAHGHCPRPPSCTTTADCGMGPFFCYHPLGSGCGSMGECRPTMGETVFCDSAAPAVCGCDGQTYTCELQALATGVSASASGSCGGGCDPQDATGTGACTTVIGVRWTGMVCETISGCACSGVDCMFLYASTGDCDAARGGCTMPMGASCGGFLGGVCRPDEWCDFSPDSCGSADELGTCQPIPRSCDPTTSLVCGCDRTTYNNACAAHAAGIDTSASAPCAAL